jgi:hypothetical protein
MVCVIPLTLFMLPVRLGKWKKVMLISNEEPGEFIAAGGWQVSERVGKAIFRFQSSSSLRRVLPLLVI